MAIILVLILGLVLRLINLNQSLWLDETVQAITSKGSFLGLFTEMVQHLWISGRFGSLSDFIMNMSGSAAVILLCRIPWVRNRLN